jgi:ribosomal protein S1
MMKKVNLDEMTKDERAQYFATGRVTVGTITQITDKSLVTNFVGKLRGRIVSDIKTDVYKWDNEADARKAAESFREFCRGITPEC